MGVAGSVSSLNKEAMEKGADRDYLKLLPFYTLDGINEKGLFVNSNVVPQDKGKVIHTECTEEKEHDMFMLMWPRFILDHFSNATEACEYAKKHISFFQIEQASQYGYDIHFMVGDATHTYVCEIIDNKFEYVEQPIMTNFHIIGTEFNDDGTVYTPVTQDDEHNAMDTNKVTEHGSGLERYNIALNNLDAANTKEGMKNLMHNLLNYNISYTGRDNNTWYTEFVGKYSTGNYTVKTSPELYEEHVMPIARQWFVDRNRDTTPQPVWHTTHTSVYDLANKRLFLFDSTEDGVEHVFDFKHYYTAAELDNIVKEIEESAVWEEGIGEHSVQTKGTGCVAEGKYSVAEG